MTQTVPVSVPHYVITVTTEQARMMQDALELWARCSIGQFKEAIEPSEPYRSEVPSEFVHDWRNLAEQMERLWRAYDMPSTIRAAKGDLAWEMHQTIRHRLSWDRIGSPQHRDWATMMGVCYDDPMRITGKPLIQIERMSSVEQF